MIIDSTSLTTFQTCPTKHDLQMRQGYKSRYGSPALTFGGAIHAGAAEWHKGRGEIAALMAIEEAWPANYNVDDFRTKGKAIDVMRGYIRRYPSENFQVKMVEVPFLLDTGMWCDCTNCIWKGDIPESPAIKVAAPSWLYDEKVFTGWECPICQHPVESIEYGGIFDGLIDFGGQIYILEHKTTSVMGSTYFNQFRPNNQISGYVWAGQQLSGSPVSGALVNAMGVYAKGETKFDRQIIGRTTDEIIEWKRNIQTVCSEIARAQHAKRYEMRTVSCTMYGKCTFLEVCQLGHQKERDRLLEQEFIVDKWDFQAQDR